MVSQWAFPNVSELPPLKKQRKSPPRCPHPGRDPMSICIETSRNLKRRWAWLTRRRGNPSDAARFPLLPPGSLGERTVAKATSGPTRSWESLRSRWESRGGRTPRGHVAAAGSCWGAAPASAAVRSGGPRSLRRPPHPSAAPSGLRRPLPQSRVGAALSRRGDSCRGATATRGGQRSETPAGFPGAGGGNWCWACEPI